MTTAKESERQAVARAGELAAAEHLERLGFERLAMNVRVGSDEADVVMRAPDGRTLVVVEVKARTDPRAWPEDRIDYKKRRSLLRLAARLGERTRPPTPVRIDAVSVLLLPDAPPAIRHFANAVSP